MAREKDKAGFYNISVGDVIFMERIRKKSEKKHPTKFLKKLVKVTKVTAHSFYVDRIRFYKSGTCLDYYKVEKATEEGKREYQLKQEKNKVVGAIKNHNFKDVSTHDLLDISRKLNIKSSLWIMRGW